MAGVQPLSNECRSVDVCFLQTAWVNMNMCLPDSTPCLTNQLFLQRLQKDSTCACRFVLFFTVLCLAYRFVSIGHVLCCYAAWCSCRFVCQYSCGMECFQRLCLIISAVWPGLEALFMHCIQCNNSVHWEVHYIHSCMMTRRHLRQQLPKHMLDRVAPQSATGVTEHGGHNATC